MTIVLAVVGTRVLACDGDQAGAAWRIDSVIKALNPDVVISGGADGVDTIAEIVASSLGYWEDNGKLVIHRPTVKRFYGAGGYRARDIVIAYQCTHLLRLACRQATTYGSGWTADYAESLGRIVRRASPCPEE